jgi:1-acyl-sn-glycerol-3-phosphate acyltransferase
VIRTLWVGVNVVAATLFFGLIAIGASLLRIRGGVYTWATRQWARAILWASATPVSVRGLENIRLDAAQVVVSNHVSWYDVFAIASVLPVPFHFVAKKELERVLFFGTAWKAAGHISIDRSDRQRAIYNLRQAGEKIRKERSTVIVFPEGTRSRTGQLQAFKKGAFMLAIEAQVPVVPTVVRGSYEIMRPDSWWIRPNRIEVYFGRPLGADELRAASSDAAIEKVRAQMQSMLGAPQPDPEALAR